MRQSSDKDNWERSLVSVEERMTIQSEVARHLLIANTPCILGYNPSGQHRSQL